MSQLGALGDLGIPPRNRILDVYAVFARTTGGWVAISDLIELLSAVGVDEQAARSATSRMKRSDLLRAEKVEGQAGYSLSPAATEILLDGDRRIFREDDDQARTWVIALFTVPETERSQRYQIRSRLEGLGFGQGPAGSWFAPSAVLPEARRVLHRNHLSAYVTLWVGLHEGFGDLARVVADAWDLALIRKSYEDYLDAADRIGTRWLGHSPAATAAADGALATPAPTDDAIAWVDYLDNLASWRSLPYLDPGLPPDVVPTDWPGDQARRAFMRLDAHLRPGAQSFYRGLIRRKMP